MTKFTVAELTIYFFLSFALLSWLIFAAWFAQNELSHYLNGDERIEICAAHRTAYHQFCIQTKSCSINTENYDEQRIWRPRA